MTTTGLSGVGTSPWEQKLHAHLRNHVAVESAMLQEYMKIAETSGSKAFRYLVNLLVEDERRHHRLFDELANSLEATASPGHGEPEIPSLDFHKAERDEVLNHARRLLANEDEDLGELKDLRKELRDFKHTSLWDLIVELMERDTEKHIAILKFVTKHA